MSKPNLILNGETSCDVVKDYPSDANVNMGAAINDISCTKHLDGFHLKENKAGIPYPLEFDHLYASNMSDSEKLTDKDSEILHLKELLLLHLDLIQQQSEQLVTKDKQISSLKLENDTLKQRLERMDRRVALHKQKDPSQPETSPSVNAKVLPELETEQKGVVVKTVDLVVPDPSDTRPLSPIPTVQDTNSIVRRKKDEKLSVSGSICSASEPKKRSRSLSWTSSVTSADITPLTKMNGGKVVKRERQTRKEKSRKRRTKVSENIEKNSENILMTDTPYWTPVGDADNIWNTDEVPVNGCELEIPKWTIKVFTSCYSMEGTENLCDDVFERRHYRLEFDERRRKRWDVQRIREQRQLEKLRQRGRKRSGGGSDGEEITSLWPSPEDAQFLQVQDTLPVAAFGCPLTKFNSVDSEFSLPWVNGKDVSQTRLSHSSRKKR